MNLQFNFSIVEDLFIYSGVDKPLFRHHAPSLSPADLISTKFSIIESYSNYRSNLHFDYTRFLSIFEANITSIQEYPLSTGEREKVLNKLQEFSESRIEEVESTYHRAQKLFHKLHQNFYHHRGFRTKGEYGMTLATQQRVSNTVTEERTLTSLAMECINFRRYEVPEFIHLFGIRDQKTIVEMALKCTEDGCGFRVPRNIHNFGITTQKDLVAVALQCAKVEPFLVCREIENFQIKRERDRYLVAMNCTGHVQYAVAKFIKKFKITNQKYLISLVNKCINESPNDTIGYFQNFRIKEEKDRFELYKAYAQSVDFHISKYIKKFEITSHEYLLELAMILSKKKNSSLEKYIKNFKILREKDRVTLALRCASSPWYVAKYIRRFEITSQRDLYRIAKKSAKLDPYSVYYLKRFRLQKNRNLLKVLLIYAEKNPDSTGFHIERFRNLLQRDLIVIAKKCGKSDGRYTSEYIKNFRINSEKARTSIAKICIKQSGKRAIKRFKNFTIKNPSLRLSVFFHALCCDPITLKYIENFQLSEGSFILSHQFKSAPFHSCHELKEERQELFDQIKNAIKDLPAKPKNTEKILKVCHEISQQTPFLQMKSGIWLISSIYLMSDLDKEGLDWMIEVGIWAHLVNLRAPDIRFKLLGDLFKLAKDKEYREVWSPLFDTTKYRWPLLSLSIIPLYTWYKKEKNLSALYALVNQLKGYQRKKRSKLRDVYKIQSLLEALQLLITSNFLSSKSKVLGLKKIFPQDMNEGSILQTISYVKPLIQLKDKKWFRETHDVKATFYSYFEKFDLFKEYDGDIIQDLKKSFGQLDISLLITYCAGLKSLNDLRLLSCFGEFLQSVLVGDFRERRYDLEHNPHLKTISKSRPDILEKWKKNEVFQLSQFVFKKKNSDAFNFNKWLDTKLFIDKHLGDLNLNYLKRYLRNPSAQNRGLSESATPSAQLQKMCIRLAKTKGEVEAVKILEDLKKLVNRYYPAAEFAHDLSSLIHTFKNPHLKREGLDLTVEITDNPRDLLLSGTDIYGSCQRLDGRPNLNKGLLGYLVDGKNMLVAVKDGEKIVARCLLRLLWNGEKPVLLRERLYPSTVTAEQMNAINALSHKRAKELGVSLVSEGARLCRSSTPLYALGGPAPYEYADCAGCICEDGRFTIYSYALMRND